MRSVRPLLVLSALTLCSLLIPGNAKAQAWSGIIDPTRAIDWSRAGVLGGIPNRATICSTLGTAGQSSTFVQSVTAAQINSALSACPASQVVFLNAGTYPGLTGIDFTGKSKVTLRGAGADQTLLKFTNGSSCGGGYGAGIDVCVSSGDNNWSGGPTNTANWTAGYAKGTTSITLSNVTNLKVGFPIILDQLDDNADTGSVFVCSDNTLTAPCSLEGNAGNAQRTGRNQEQYVAVVSCGTANVAGQACTGTNVTITPGLYMPNWSANKSPQAWWASQPIQGVGIENLSMDHTSSSGNKGVFLFNCQDCWVKGVRSIDSGKAHVECANSSRVSILDSYFYLTQNSVSQSYGVESLSCSDMLTQNNIFQYVAAPYIINGSCEGCIFSYNYSINNYYTASSGYVLAASNQHMVGADMMLYEGNIGDQLYADVFHGTHNFVTIFRNQWIGNQPACWQSGTYPNALFGSCNNAQNAILLYSYSRFYNVIGNVLGQVGIHTAYSNSTGASGSIYVIGAGDSESVTVLPDALVATTLMRWGNYDTVNAAARFLSTEVPASIANFANPVPVSQTLPPSFYLSSKPSWWPSGKAWPPIGPDVTGGNVSGVGGHVNTIPAQDCYSNMMGGLANGTGSVLTFNAGTCYASGSVQLPSPPTNLNAVVH